MPASSPLASSWPSSSFNVMDLTDPLFDVAVHVTYDRGRSLCATGLGVLPPNTLVKLPNLAVTYYAALVDQFSDGWLAVFRRL